MDNEQSSPLEDQLQNNINTIKDLLSHCGKTNEYYNNIITNVNSINEMVKEYSNLSLTSIKKDLLEYSLNIFTIDEKKAYIQNALNNRINMDEEIILDKINFKKIDFQELNDELFVDLKMYINLETKKQAAKFLKIKKEIINNLDDFMLNFKNTEQFYVEQRNSLYDIMKNNTEKLLKLHQRYINNIRNKKNNEEFINYGKVKIPYKRSQKDFLLNSLGILLKVDDLNINDKMINNN